MISETVSVAVPGGVELPGDMNVPPSPRGVVLFVHGSGSSRHSPRNRAVAEDLRRHGWATLLTDLLSEEEERADAVTGQYRFDISLLAERTVATVDWLGKYPLTEALPVHLFGASTGAAAALVAAAERSGPVVSVVSRGGRPDLAGDALGRVDVPVLLLVGGRDQQVLELNREAAQQLDAEHRVQVVPGATHLFEEPGALQQVAAAAHEWFLHAAEEQARGDGLR
ncbi:dienelactone hydrolase family protein [Streptomyces sp. WMMB 322]|uniref:dienelactone hydrolase family protein n=1 Tax=Streptomyces sp. WMMB 322 TaxID=1286821 RepID=UPI0006E1AB71|nr:dienelactone hydrolase family protein [Streptomyces sp. WMMB 322]SCK57065.1 Dienelactone hydrolase [Streptomyces sp. WMMB 322]